MSANGMLIGAFSVIAGWCYKKTFSSGKRYTNYNYTPVTNKINNSVSTAYIERKSELQEAEKELFNTNKAYVAAVPCLNDLEDTLYRCSSGYDGIYKIIGPTIREEMYPILAYYNNNLPKDYVLYTFVLRKGYEIWDEEIVHLPTKIIMGEKLPSYPWAYSGLNPR